MCDSEYFTISYNKLLYKLFNTKFIVVIPLDKHRISDVFALRSEYGITTDIPCSVLEILIALAIRGEEQIMYDRDVGNRIGQWFWEMIGNMGLGHMTDEHYDEDYCNDILRRFNYHDYTSDGLGCAFRSAKHPDLRDEELWYQMNYHFDDIIGGITYENN